MNSLEEETDSGSNSIPLIPKENHMNDGDHERFLKYLDPEFLEAVPDEHAIDMDLIALKFKEKLNLSLDENDTEVKHLSAQDRPTAMPREYQFELFQKAVKENTIAVLGTGAGKTLISVMLMKHMSMIEREQRLVRRNVIPCFVNIYFINLLSFL
jgi:DNA replication protein DnaC